MEDGWDKDKNYLNTTRDIKLSNVYNLITITDLSGNYSNNTSYQLILPLNLMLTIPALQVAQQ